MTFVSVSVLFQWLFWSTENMAALKKKAYLHEVFLEIGLNTTGTLKPLKSNLW
jgi:hypothetical protein